MRKLIDKDLVKIKLLLQPLINAPIDCDGKTQIIHTIFNKLEIPHNCNIGEVRHQNKRIAPHFWLETIIDRERYLVDYSLQDWTNIPNCLEFYLINLNPQNLTFIGETTEVWTVPDSLFEVIQLDPRSQQIITLESVNKFEFS